MAVTGNQIRAGRSLAGFDQKTLAAAAGIGINTIRNMEARGDDRVRVRLDTLDAIKDALKEVGVVFLEDGETSSEGIGVRLVNFINTKPKKRRKIILRDTPE